MAPSDLTRYVDAYPFVPRDPSTRDKRCKLITEIQVRGLKKRLKQVAKKWGGIKKYAEWLVANGKPLCVLGVSGGLDSTHALNIVIKTLDELEVPRSLLHGYTLPGFGTTSRTYDNAWKLMKLTGITAKEVDIRARCLIAWMEESYKPFGIDLDELRTRCQGIVKEKFAGGEETDLMTVMLEEFGKLLTELPPDKRKDLVFENKQARARTDILMNAGFVIGTGDLSELAVGWCTYNGDHMLMYGVNSGIPKTLVHFLVKWAAEYWFKGELGAVLIDVAETEVSPELLPPGKDGKIAQKTNSSIGPADLRTSSWLSSVAGRRVRRRSFTRPRTRNSTLLTRRKRSGTGSRCTSRASSRIASSTRACPTGPRWAASASRRVTTGTCLRTRRTQFGSPGSPKKTPSRSAKRQDVRPEVTRLSSPGGRWICALKALPPPPVSFAKKAGG